MSTGQPNPLQVRLASRFAMETFATAQELASESAQFIAATIVGVVAQRGDCVLALSGGTTPAATYRCLSRLVVPWESVRIFQTDERITDARAQRAASTIEDHLVGAAPVPLANWYPMLLTPQAEPAVQLAEYAASLCRFRPNGHPDVVLLGLGEDGHTASLFEGDAAVDAVATVAMSRRYQGTVRMTLTTSSLGRAVTRLIIATGPAKRPAVERLTTVIDPSSASAAARILGSDGCLFVDAEASPPRRPVGRLTTSVRVE